MSNSIPWLPNNPIAAPDGVSTFMPGSPLQPKSTGTDKAAVAAFVYGLAGLIIPFVPPVIALFLGIGAKRNIKASEALVRCGGMANAAIILGAVMLGLNVLITSLLFL